MVLLMVTLPPPPATTNPPGWLQHIALLPSPKAVISTTRVSTRCRVGAAAAAVTSPPGPGLGGLGVTAHRRPAASCRACTAPTGSRAAQPRRVGATLRTESK